MGKWAEIAENLKRRDTDQVESVTGMFGGGWTLENRLSLADGRATDALTALIMVLKHLDEMDEKITNIAPQPLDSH